MVKTSMVGSGPKSNSSATAIPCKMSLKNRMTLIKNNRPVNFTVKLQSVRTSFGVHGPNRGPARPERIRRSLKFTVTSMIFHYFLQMYHFRLHSFWFFEQWPIVAIDLNICLPIKINLLQFLETLSIEHTSLVTSLLSGAPWIKHKGTSYGFYL